MPQQELSSDVLADAPDDRDWAVVQARLNTFLRARGARPELIDDVIQETLVRLLTISREKEIASIFALGFRIAENLLIDQYRGEARLAGEPDVEWNCDRPSADRVVDSRRAMEVFQRCLNNMPPLRREVLVRRRVRQETCRTIADDLSMSAKAVEKHITRGLIDLRRAMDKAGIDPTGWSE